MTLIELFQNTTFWVGFVLPFLGSLGFLYASFTCLRHTRIMEDTPTSKIRSAAQGYLELEGQQHSLGAPLQGELSQIPCTWYECRIEKKVVVRTQKDTSTHWDEIYSSTSHALFLLKDETGECVIDPRGADVKPDTVTVWYGHSRKPSPPPETWWQKLFAAFGSYRYTEKRMNIDSPVYAIGMFETINTPKMIQECAKDSDSPEVVKNWLESELKQLEGSQATMNILSRCGLPSRRPFLISSYPQETIIFRNRMKAFCYFIIFMILSVMSLSFFY